MCEYPTDSSLPGSSVHGILQTRILEWVAVPSSRGSSRPRDGTHTSYVSRIGRQVLYHQRHLGSPGGVMCVYKFTLATFCHCPATALLSPSMESNKMFVYILACFASSYIWKRLWNMSEEAECYLQQIKLMVLQCGGGGTTVRAIVSTRILAVLV